MSFPCTPTNPGPTTTTSQMGPHPPGHCHLPQPVTPGPDADTWREPHSPEPLNCSHQVTLLACLTFFPRRHSGGCCLRPLQPLCPWPSLEPPCVARGLCGPVSRDLREDKLPCPAVTPAPGHPPHTGEPAPPLAARYASWVLASAKGSRL